MERILKEIHADYAYERGWFGQGVGIAVLDTGVSLHPDLQGQVVRFWDYMNGKNTCYDDNGHGTHICGIISAKNKTALHGVATESRLYVCKVLDRLGNGRIEDTCRAVDELIRFNREHRQSVRILNISVGMTDAVRPNLQRSLIAAVEKAWDSGIVVLAAAGNNGPEEHTITSPGISRKIITVGSIDDQWDLQGQKGYSGRGPTQACVVKPEILMPGTNILSCSNRKDGYTRKSGTSMAVPVLSGVIALLLNAHPSLTPNEVKMRLFYAARRVEGSGGGKNWGTVTLDGLL